MLKDILMYMSTKSMSRLDMLIVVVASVLCINNKWVKGLILLLVGGLIGVIIKVGLGI